MSKIAIFGYLSCV